MFRKLVKITNQTLKSHVARSYAHIMCAYLIEEFVTHCSIVDNININTNLCIYMFEHYIFIVIFMSDN